MRKRFGQHFLHDQSIINFIVHTFNPQLTDHIIEIGGGKGALTFALLKYIDALIVVEIDHNLVPILQNNCPNNKQLKIINEDVLNVDFNLLAKSTSLRIIGNLPYNISTPLLFHLLKYKTIIKDMFFMVQREVAERLVAVVNTSEYGRLSIMIQHDFSVKYLLTIPPEAFNPPPQVFSAIISLTPKLPIVTEANYLIFSQIVNSAFQQRRKMLRNNLSAYVSTDELECLGLNPCARPAELTIQDYANLTIFYAEKLNKSDCNILINNRGT